MLDGKSDGFSLAGIKLEPQPGKQCHIRRHQLLEPGSRREFGCTDPPGRDLAQDCRRDQQRTVEGRE